MKKIKDRKACQSSDCKSKSSTEICQDLMHRTWNPCTSGKTIEQHLNSQRFPTKQMEMYTTLQAAKTENCQASSDTTGVPLHFDVFANSVYKYSMWKSELQVSQNDLGAYQKGLFYISTCERALSDFDKDREKCLALGDHDCLGQLLWGNTFLRPLENLQFLYYRYTQELQYQASFYSPKSINSSMGSSQNITPLNSIGQMQNRNGEIDYFHMRGKSTTKPEMTLSEIQQNIQKHGLFPSMHYIGDDLDTSCPRSEIIDGHMGFSNADRHGHTDSKNNDLTQDGSTSSYNGLESDSSGSTSISSQDTHIHMYSAAKSQDQEQHPFLFLEQPFREEEIKGGLTTEESLREPDQMQTEQSSTTTSNTLTKRRAEQNRQKSRKYYQKKKVQRLVAHSVLTKFRQTLESLQTEGCGGCETWILANAAVEIHKQQKGRSLRDNKMEEKSPLSIGNAEMNDISSYLMSPLDSNSNLEKFTSKVEKKKLAWRLQKEWDILLVQQLSLLARLLAAYPSRLLANSNKDLWNPDTSTQQKLLATWLSMRLSWRELSMAETRLNKGQEDTPIAFLIFVTQDLYL